MLCDTRLGAKPRWYLTPPEDWNMRVPDEVRECVIFLGVRVQRPGGITEDVWGGTGFLVGFMSEMFPDKRTYAYLVTAKHVVDEMERGEPIIRINTKEGGATTVSLGRGSRWHFHPDAEHVGVAVLSLRFDVSHVEYKLFPGHAFLSDEVIQQRNIGTGDEVFMTGLFMHHMGSERNIPIVRMGNVAMMPGETVPTEYGDIEAYLIEARSIGGLSGSPVFVTESTYVDRPSFFLMGLMHGHWKVAPGDVNPESVSNFARWNEPINMGIAIVVPAKKIMEVLNVPELRAERVIQDRSTRRENLPTMDSAIPPSPTEEESFTREDFENALKKVSRRATPSPPDQETT